MTEAEKICGMLKDPDSCDDEIDANIQWFLNKECWEKEGWIFNENFRPPRITKRVMASMKPRPPKYTTSLDAAMSIGAEELEGWAMTIESVLVTETVGDVDMPSKIMWDADIDKDGAGFGMNAGLTAPRAVCHARIQALEYLRREEG